MLSTSYRESGTAESQVMESLMKRVAEKNRGKPYGQVSYSAFKALFDLSWILLS